MALKICQFLIRKNQALNNQTFISRVGLITPYKKQVHHFRDLFKKNVDSNYHQLQINTVDSFQVSYLLIFLKKINLVIVKIPKYL